MKPLYHHPHFIEEEIGPSHPHPQALLSLLWAVVSWSFPQRSQGPIWRQSSEKRIHQTQDRPEPCPCWAAFLLPLEVGTGVSWRKLCVLSQGPLRNAVGSSHPLGWVVPPSGTGMTARRQWPAAPGATARAVRQPRNAGRRKPARQHEPTTTGEPWLTAKEAKA